MKRGNDRTIVKSLIDTFGKAESENRSDFRTGLLEGAMAGSKHKQVALALLMREPKKACRITQNMRMSNFDVDDLLAYCDGLGLQWSLGREEQQAPLEELLGEAA